MWNKRINLGVVEANNNLYQDLSFIFFARNDHNFFLRKLTKQGLKSKLNNHTLKSIMFINKIVNIFGTRFNVRFSNFIYGLFYNFLVLNCKVFVTKGYKVIKRERNYFYSFLLKKQRVSEIFRWVSKLLFLQYDYKIDMQIAWIFFELYYYYEVSEINSIKLNLLSSFSQQKQRKLKKTKKKWVLGRVIKFYCLKCNYSNFLF